MKFAVPQMLWLMAGTLPLLGWFYWWAWRKKQNLIRQFVQVRLLPQLTTGVSTRREKARALLQLLAITLLFLALARPQWGFAWEEAKQRGLDLIVAIDTSRSMLATDLNPNRLARAKLAAFDLVKLARTDRLGLVAFAGTAFLQVPLTLDDHAFREGINALEVGIIPQGGSAVAEALDAALAAFKSEGENHRALVLFTDGEDHDSGALEAAKKAAKAGLRIFTIGVGTPAGELLRSLAPSGESDWIRDDQGNAVKSRLNETLLQEIATAANGFYLPLRGANTMETLYERGLAPLPKAEIQARLIQRYHERFQWPLAIAIALLMADVFLRARKPAVTSRSPVPATARRPVLQTTAILLAWVWPFVTLASPSSASRKYEKGDYHEALDDYRKLLDSKPDDPRLQFNAGAAAYRTENYAEAAKDFEAASRAPDLKLQQQSFYNLGNSFFRHGEKFPEPGPKMEQWEQSLKSFENALRLEPKDEDARLNRDLVQKRIEELKQQQAQQDKSDKNQENKDDDKQNQQEQSKDENSKDQKSNEQNQKEDSQDQQSQRDQQDQKSDQDQSPKKDEADQSKSEQKDDAQQKPGKDQQAKGEGQDGDQDQEDGDASEAVPLGRMTPQQARQMLEAQKADERAMIFTNAIPRQSRARIFKDW